MRIYVIKFGCKITAFFPYTQTFVTKNATILCKNTTKNRLFIAQFKKKQYLCTKF